LGSGAARGWAHIGVIRTLEEAGIVPDLVCGTSIGALVGAAYAAGQLDRLEPWVQGLGWQQVVGLLDLKMGGGLIQGGKLVDFFRHHFRDPGIEQLQRPFACVATELGSGREVWLREGAVIDAVRASIAIPGLFTPAAVGGRLLVDGGVVNPVPVSLCRAMGADVVIAVDLNWQLLSRRHRVAGRARAQVSTPNATLSRPSVLDAVLGRFQWSSWKPGSRSDSESPSMLDVLTTSLNIMQMRITQSRLAGDPADVVVRPRLTDIAAMDFHRGAPIVVEGRRAARAVLPQLQEALQGWL
jgi:NTE family protein